MQYLEGSGESLDVIYDNIQQDKTHSGLIMISRESIEKRQFAVRSMAFQTGEFEGYVGSPGQKNLIDSLLELPADNPNPARFVLRGLRERSGA